MEPSLLLLRLPGEVAELLGELSQRPLSAEQRVIVRLPLVLPPASRERARWRQHLPCPRDIGHREARSPPEPLRHVEMRDDADVSEKMLHQLGPGTADEPLRPRDLGILGGSLAMIAGGDGLERHEGGRSGSLPLEIGEGFARVLEALHDHPLEAIAEHCFHGRLQTRRHVQEIGHCPDHACHCSGGVRREERSHTRAVAFALALQPVEGLARRFLGGDGDAQGGQRLLGVGPERFLSSQLLLHLLALAGEQRELDARLLEARLEAPSGRGQPVGFGARPCGFTFEAFAPAIELRYALAKLARIARQLGAVAGGSDLLEAQGLDGRAAKPSRASARARMVSSRLTASSVRRSLSVRISSPRRRSSSPSSRICEPICSRRSRRRSTSPWNFCADCRRSASRYSLSWMAARVVASRAESWAITTRRSSSSRRRRALSWRRASWAAVSPA